MSKLPFTPLIRVTLIYITGIAVSRFCPQLHPQYSYIAALTLILAGVLSYFLSLFSLKNRRLCLYICLGVAIFLFGTGYYRAKVTPGHNDVSRLLSRRQNIHTLVGRIKNIPQFDGQKTRFTLKIVTEKMHRRIRGNVYVILKGKDENLNMGKIIKANGFLGIPDGAKNPGEFDFRDYLARQSIFSIMFVKGKGEIEVIEDSSSTREKMIVKLREHIRYILREALSIDSSKIMEGMMLGERRNLDSYFREIFIEAGAVHILAVSGLHVGLVGGLFFLSMRMIYIKKNIAYIVTLLVVISYIQLTGARPSAVRAGIMFSSGVFALLLERDKHLFNSLFLSSLIILILNPAQLFDAGFQLSFAATFGILYFTPFIYREIRLMEKSSFSRFLLLSLGISLGVQVFTYPILAFHFNRVSLVGIFTNIVVVSLSGIILALGFIISIFGAFAISIARMVGFVNEIMISSVLGWTRAFASLPFSCIRISTPGIWQIFLWYTFFLILPFMRRSVSYRRVTIGIIILASISLCWGKIWRFGRVSLTFLDLGEGDAIHIRLPNNEALLIDGGGASDRFDVGERIVAPYLRKRGVRKIRAVFLTIPHYSNLAGLNYILNNFKVESVYMPDPRYFNYCDKDCIIFLENIVKKRIPLKLIKGGDIFNIGEIGIEVLNPYRISNDKRSIYQQSLVMLLKWGRYKILTTSHIPYDVQKELAKSNIKADILQIPSSGEATIHRNFWENVSPKYAIITRKKLKDELFKQLEGVDTFATRDLGAIDIHLHSENKEPSVCFGRFSRRRIKI